MPLEFLRRKGSSKSAAAVPEAAAPPIPEEAVAEEHNLRLTFGAKTSNGVRMHGGPQILAALSLAGGLGSVAFSLLSLRHGRTSRPA